VGVRIIRATRTLTMIVQSRGCDVECEHENIRWLSGDENADITLNGRVVAECLDCNMVAERSGDV
jgi:hypothetical protein